MGIDFSSSIAYLSVSDNIKIRYGIWPSDKEPVGSVLLLNGRSEFLEKYKEPIEKLKSRGYYIYSIDWRGQGLSTRLLKNRHKGYVKDFTDYIKDLLVFFNKIIEPGAVKPVIMLAHSMGGNIAIRFIHDFPGLVEKAVLTAPMFGINTTPIPVYFVRLLSKYMINSGLEQSYVIGNGDYIAESQKFKGNKLTSDPKRFKDHINAVIENPKLALGGVTYGWLSAAFDSIGVISKPGYFESIKTKILLVSGKADRIVSIKAQKRYSQRMLKCKFILINEAKHEILKERKDVQATFWDAFDQFIGN